MSKNEQEIIVVLTSVQSKSCMHDGWICTNEYYKVFKKGLKNNEFIPYFM